MADVRRLRVDAAYLACQLVIAAVFVAFVIGSLLFTGGQVLQDADRSYEQAWDWPVFPVPAWLLIIPATISAVLVIPLVATTSVADAPDLIGRWGQTIVSVGAGFGFAAAFRASDGSLGGHWVAAAMSAFCFLVIVLGMIVKLPAHERLRKAGKLPDRIG